MIVWHYTTGDALASILTSGQIRCSTPTDWIITEILPDEYAKFAARIELTSERPVVWLSSRQTWEPVATRWYVESGVPRAATLGEMFESHGGLARIGVEREGLYTLAEHLESGGVHPDSAKRYVRGAEQCGSNPDDWYVSYEPVGRSRWVAIERGDLLDYVMQLARREDDEATDTRPSLESIRGR